MPKARRYGLVVAAVIAGASAPIAASAPPPDLAPPKTGVQVPVPSEQLPPALRENNKDIRAGAERRRERADRRRSREARQERQESRRRYRDLPRDEALALGRREFPRLFSDRNFDGRRPAPGLEVEDHLGRGTAVVENDDGENFLAVSSMPLLTQSTADRMAPVDLSLRDQGDAFTTANSPTDIRISPDPDKGTEFVSGDFSVAPQTGSEAAGEQTDGRVVYPDVAKDTSFVAVPRPAGAIFSWLLTSPDSPERLVLDLDLPDGATVRRTRTDAPPIPGDPPRTFEIVKGDDVLGYVEPPLATDSDDQLVPTEATVEDGRRIAISVEHRDRDFKFPISVDPEVSTYSTAGSWPGWVTRFTPSNPFTSASYNINYYGFALNDARFNPNGVYLSMPTNTYYSGSGTGVSFAYQAPPSTYIYNANFGGTSHKPLLSGATFSQYLQGLIRSDLGAWEPNVNYTNGSGIGGNPLGPTGAGALLDSNDFCYLPRCNKTQGSERNHAYMGLSAKNDANPSQTFYTYGYHAALTMDRALVFLGDRYAPSMITRPPNREWTNDSNSLVHTLGSVRADDQGLGMKSISLSGAASGNGTISSPCTGRPYTSEACQPSYTTSGFSYRLNEGINTLSLTPTDIVDRNGAPHTWTEKIDRTKPKLELNGWLPNTDGLVFTGVPYDLSVVATDSVSGVQSIEVLVDGQRLPQDGFKQQDCGRDGCDLILNTALITDTYGAGPRTVKVIARDFAGNQEQTEIPVEISAASAAEPRERDPIADEPGDPAEDAPEPADEVGIDTTCDPDATSGADTDCGRNDLDEPLEQAVAAEPPLVDNVATPLLNTLGSLLTGTQAQRAQAGSLTKNGSGWGLSDQKAQTFVPDNPATPNRIDDPSTPGIDEGYLDLFTGLDVTRLRLVVPWDLVPRGMGRFDGDPYPKSFAHRDPDEDRLIVDLGPFSDDPATPTVVDPNEVRGAVRRLKETDEWISRALPCNASQRLGEVMISFEKSTGLRSNPNDRDHENLLPGVQEYVYGVSEFRKRYLGRCSVDKDRDETSRITVFTAWNEPNFGRQPTRGDRLDRAGAYWSQLNRICKTTPVLAYRCTVAAGDFIDRRFTPDPDDGLSGDIRRYADGMNRPASAWALHAYRSSHSPFESAQARIRRFLKLTTSESNGQAPRLWLTEQGGRFDVPAGEPPPTPAADFCNLMRFRQISDRITRFYYYPMVGPAPQPSGMRSNDSALIALNTNNTITVRDPQYETYKFYTTRTQGSQRC